jgi:NitT/TauT family transport system ATP-binding protein
MQVLVSDVNHAFDAADGQRVPALADVSLSIREGELLAIVGPSGCGKTTLLNMIAGLVPHDSGTITLDGKPPRAGEPRVGYVLARDSLLPWRTALGNAELAMEVHGVPREARGERARRSLSLLGLDRFMDHYPAQLSHGMRQRVALARSFGGAPDLMLMDEPFSALDAQTRLSVHDMFLDVWERQRMTVVLITHDLTEAVGLADRVAIMTRRPGRIKAIHDIGLPRPRSMMDLQGSREFHRIYESIWRDLQTEFSDTADRPVQRSGGPDGADRDRIAQHAGGLHGAT